MRCVRDTYREGGPAQSHYGKLQYHERVYEGGPTREVVIVIEPIDSAAWPYPAFENVANECVERAKCEISKARIWELSADGQVKQHDISIVGKQDISPGDNSGDGGQHPVMRSIFNSKITPIDDEKSRYVLGEVLLSHTQRHALDELRHSQSFKIELTPS